MVSKLTLSTEETTVTTSCEAELTDPHSTTSSMLLPSYDHVPSPPHLEKGSACPPLVLYVSSLNLFLKQWPYYF
jgi:hypothetical protein